MIKAMVVCGLMAVSFVAGVVLMMVARLVSEERERGPVVAEADRHD